MSPRQTTAEKYFPKVKSGSGFPRDTPRKFVIANRVTGESVRTRGMMLAEALHRLGWSEDDVVAVDFGPASGEPGNQFITRYVPIEEPVPGGAADE